MLPSTERETVTAWLDALGLEAGDWPALPALASIVELVAVMRRAVDMDTPARNEAIRWAAEELGLEDDGGRRHPAEKYIKGLYRWHCYAAEHRAGHNVQNDTEGAA